jgi:hypothetical protein
VEKKVRAEKIKVIQEEHNMAHTKMHKSNRQKSKENTKRYDKSKVKEWETFHKERDEYEEKDGKEEAKSEDIFNADGPLAKVRQKRWANKMKRR